MLRARLESDLFMFSKTKVKESPSISFEYIIFFLTFSAIKLIWYENYRVFCFMKTNQRYKNFHTESDKWGEKILIHGALKIYD